MAVGAAAVIVLALAVLPWPFAIVAPCVLQPIERRQIRILVNATVESVSVEEGQRVKQGDLLATLDLGQLKVDQAKTLADIGAVTAELKRTQGASRPDLSKLREFVELRGAQMRIAYLEFRRIEALKEKGLSGEAELKAATAAIVVARRALTEAQTALGDAMSNTPDEIRRKELELERLRATLGKQNELVAQPEIRSPIDGTIASRDVRGRAGQPLQAGGELMEIVQLDKMRAEARLPQHALGKVHVGAPVQVGIAGVTQTFASRLELVGSMIELEEGVRFVRVVAFVDNPQLTLRQNTEGWLELEGERESILRVLLWRAGVSG